MIITYQLTAEDFTEGIREHWNASFALRWSKRFLVTVGLIMSASFLFLIIADAISPEKNGSHTIANSLPGVFIGLAWLAYFYFMPVYAGRKQFQSNPSARGPIELTVDDQGFSFKSMTGESVQTWAAYYRWIENKKIYSMYFSKAAFQPIPKRAMSPAQLEEFRALLKSHIVTPK